MTVPVLEACADAGLDLLWLAAGALTERAWREYERRPVVRGVEQYERARASACVALLADRANWLPEIVKELDAEVANARG